MKLVVGLGNPGEKYQRTRHNVGFWVVDELVHSLRGVWKIDTKLKGMVAVLDQISRPDVDSVVLAGASAEKVIVLKPMTYMNLSGEAVQAVMNYYKIETQDVHIVVDDLYHTVGTLRVRQGGSAGGHNGLRSVIAHAGGDFWRWRVGVGPQPSGVPAEKFVLAKINKTKQLELESAAEKTSLQIMTDLLDPQEQTIVFKNSQPSQAGAGHSLRQAN